MSSRLGGRLAVGILVSVIALSVGAIHPNIAVAKKCGDIERAGVQDIHARGIGCDKARRVARDFRRAGPDFERGRYRFGFRCRAESPTFPLARPAACRRGTDRVRFIMVFV